MRTEEELRAFLRDELAPAARALAKRREAALAAIPWGRYAVIAILATVVSIYLRHLAPLAIAIAIPAFQWIKATGRYRSDVKETLVRRVLTFWNPSVEYQPMGFVDEETFRASGLFSGGWSQYGGEDLVRGTVGETRFTFSELRVRRKQGKGTEPVFSGLFFRADFNKRFRGRTLLLPDRAERILGVVGRALQQLSYVPGCNLVELEDPAFERFFSVYASDPVEARYLLSPSLMERLRRFRENVNCPLRVSFVDDHLFLALPLETSLFEANGTKHGVDLATMQTWVGELGLATGIVEDLDLNTRIWSKPARAERRASAG